MVKIVVYGKIAKVSELMVRDWVTLTFQDSAQGMRFFIKLGQSELHLMTGQTTPGSSERFLPP